MPLASSDVVTSRSAGRRRATSVTPVDREAPFAADERFFSATDARGRIRLGNEVFVRTSGYARDDLVGAPHNLIRHPDMPRAVFRLLWQRLEAGESMVAYVKNLAADGAYYWVLALVVPAPSGYLSVRIKPATPLFALIRDTYAAMRRAEADAEDGTRDGRERGMAAALDVLDERLQAAGFADYATFEHTALVGEVQANPAATHATVSPDTPLAPVAKVARDLDVALDTMLADTRSSTDLSEAITQRAQFVVGLAERMRTYAINALLAAGRLGTEGAAQAAVAELMRACSDDIGVVIVRLDRDFTGLLGELDTLAFRAAAGRMQLDMARDLIAELVDHADTLDDRHEDLTSLAACLGTALSGLLDAGSGVVDRTSTVLADLRRLESLLRRMRTLVSSGRVETARLVNTRHALGSLFDAIAEQVDLAGVEVGRLRQATSGLGTIDERVATSARRQVDRLAELVGRVGAPDRSEPPRR